MIITVTIRNSNNEIIEEKIFTQDESKPFSQFNINYKSMPSLILLVIRYLSSLGPY